MPVAAALALAGALGAPALDAIALVAADEPALTGMLETPAARGASALRVGGAPAARATLPATFELLELLCAGPSAC
jgi:hypothetical protein